MQAEDIPSAFAAGCQNIRFRPGSVQTRSGLKALTGTPPSGASYFTSAVEFTDNQDNHTIFVLDSGGTLYQMNLFTNTLTQIAAQVCVPGAYMKGAAANNRLYLSFYTYLTGGGPIAAGPVRQWNQGVLEPFSNPGPGGKNHLFSTGTLASGSTTVSNVTNIQMWSPGDQISDSSGFIPAGTTVTSVNASGATLTISAAATGSVPTAFLSQPVPSPASSGTGEIVPGVHGVAVSFVTRSLYVTEPTPIAFWNATGISAPATPTLSSVAGGSLGAATYYIVITLVNATGETLPSAEASIAVAANNLPSVASPPATPGATGYNVYVGTASGLETLQTHSPIQIGTNWTLPVSGLVAGGPPPTVASAGSAQVQVSNIPTGPPNVVARRLYFTPSGSTDLYFLPAFQINDNTTTSALFNFNDTDLLNGELVNNLFNNARLPDCGGVAMYNARTALWASDNPLPFNNIGFDGGIDSVSGKAQPLGWIPGASVAGGSVDSADAFYGNCWKITGDGVTAVRGRIENTDAPLLILPSTAYRLRVWLKGAGLTQGSVQIGLSSSSLAKDVYMSVGYLNLTSGWKLFEGPLIGNANFPTIPNDLVLYVEGTGTINNGGTVFIDHIEVVPDLSRYSTGQILFSDAYNNERFDSQTGFVTINKDDGQKVAACGQLRGYWYVLKERSMWVTFDDSVNPPAFWSASLIDDAVGAGGPACVAEFEEMLVIASRPGAYFFLGGRPVKMSQEVQNIWSSINWAAAATIHVSIDPQARLMRFFFPVGSSTVPNSALTLDYVEGLGQEVEPGGRKWNPDVYPVTIYGHFVGNDENNNQQVYMIGPKIYQVGGTDDDGVAIDCFYQTAFARATPTGQSLFGGASMTLSGSGSLKASLVGLGGSPVNVLLETTLTNPMTKDLELYGNLESERASLKIETAGLGANFSARRLAIMVMPWAEQRAH